MRKSLNGTTVEMTEAEILGAGFLHDGGDWVMPKPPAYTSAAQAKSAINAWINRLTAQVEDQYPSAVQKGWPEEEAMAAAQLAGTATPEQLATLTADASAKSRTPTEHATIILAKAQSFRAILDEVRRLWLETDGLLDAVTDPMEYEAIVEAAKAQAAPIAATYGLTVPD